MSSSYGRDPLSGIIRQDQKVVGAICLPEEELQDFIDEFNHCYGPLNLHIDKPAFCVASNHPLIPVGARQPRRELFPSRYRSDADDS